MFELRMVIAKLVKAINYAEEILLAYVSLGLAALIVVGVISRKLGLPGLFWLEELGRYILIFATFLGASIAVKYASHPAMVALVTSVPARAAHVIKSLTSFVCFAFFAWLDYYAWLHIIHMADIGVKTSTLGVPFYVPYLPVAIFCAGIFVRYLLISVKEFQALIKKEDLPPELQSSTNRA